MTGSVAVDVVIGLIFVFLLYSLLATTVTEIISNWLRMRQRFLAIGIRRMLDDGSKTKIFSERFFQQPLLKYLTSDSAWFARYPAYLSAESFSKNLQETLIDVHDKELCKATMSGLKMLIAGCKGNIQIQLPSDDQLTRGDLEFIRAEAENGIADPLNVTYRNTFEEIAKCAVAARQQLDTPTSQKIRKVLYDGRGLLGRSETIRHVRSLLEDASGDLLKFSALVKQWYNETMDRTSSWYKKSVQRLTFLVGLAIAILFNVDTMLIVNILSKDADARNKLVNQAIVSSPPAPTVVPSGDSTLQRLLENKEVIEKDITSANAILGIGWDFPDWISILSEEQRRDAIKANEKLTEADFLRVKTEANKYGYILLTAPLTKTTAPRVLVFKNDWIASGILPWFGDTETPRILDRMNENKSAVQTSKWKLFYWSLWGYVITALALSLGSPFWFDLLNKFIRLRASVQPPQQDSKTARANSTEVPLSQRVG